jgi:antitoxin component YwqK of YwqJK toxin-antitoxin module
MKNIFIATLLMLSGVFYAQEVKPKYEVVNNMVKATYYHDNGQIKQEGFYLDGKLHGKWTSYTESGSKQTMGEYESGAKVGKWFFWNDKSLSEVDFYKNKIDAVKKWSQDALVNN